MGKKMKLPTFLFKSNNREADQHHHQSTKNSNPWRQWPSCKHPKTLSFRISDDMFRTVNSVFFDPNDVISAADTTAAAVIDTPESWFTNSSASASFSTESEEYYAGESLETVVRAARSERLFFEPGTDTSSILEKTNSGTRSAECGGSGGGEIFPYRESVVLAMESDDPYGDFRRSMEEMVEIHGVKDWECLEELLGWYLRVNGKNNHGFIIGAFVDLLVNLAGGGGGSGGSCGCNNSSTTTTTAETSFSSAISCFSANSSSSSIMRCSDNIRGRIVNEIDEEERTLTR